MSRDRDRAVGFNDARIVIIGWGYIGIELASVLGALSLAGGNESSNKGGPREVLVVMRKDTILSEFDREV